MDCSRQEGGVTELVFPVCAGVRAADRSLVSGEHRLLPLHAGSVLPGQRGGSEGGSANEKLRDHCETVLRFPCNHHKFPCVLQALQCFQEAATEVEKEEFLMRLTGSEDEEAAASSPRLQYYNKVPTSEQALQISNKRFYLTWKCHSSKMWLLANNC